MNNISLHMGLSFSSPLFGEPCGCGLIEGSDHNLEI